MKGPRALSHPFGQAVLLLALSYVLFKYGIAYLPPLLGADSAPVPASVLLQFMLVASVGIFIFVSENEDRWRRFKEPISATLVAPDKKWLRTTLLVAAPLGIGYLAFQAARPSVPVPISLRSIHPAPPGQISFQGRTIALTGLENPLRSRGEMADHLLTGRRVYYQNCLPCHGDRLDGQGHYAHGFSPTPLAFDDPGTIAQLTESFVFWRIAKGGPGLPREGTPWSSAMPAWEDFLSEDEIWSVIIYLYDHSGFQPRRWEAAGAEGESHD
jgi:mono/diheme cytochrome c family protein